MHYTTRISHWMQKHKFNVTCPDALFMETAPFSPEHEKECINISCPGGTGIHYVTRISIRMQKHKFDATCPSVLLMETTPVPPEREK
jgi:hypothetical protein